MCGGVVWDSGAVHKAGIIKCHVLDPNPFLSDDDDGGIISSGTCGVELCLASSGDRPLS